jgi:iron complex outermembrane receptor protein
LTFDYDVNDYAFTSISAYRSSEFTQSGDNDSSPRDILYVDKWHDRTKFWSQEFRLASPANETFDYILGVYLFGQNVTTDVPFRAGADNAVPGVSTVFADIDTRGAAGFVHANYHPTDRITLSGGVRYTNERKELNDFHAVGPVAFGGVFQFPSVTDERTDSDVSPMASITYAFSDDVNAYAKVARGFKSGGWNTDFISRPTHTPPPIGDIDFEPETATTYEIGLKSLLAGRRLQLNGAVFQTDYKDLQVQSRIFDPSTGLFASVFNNAASSTITGAELEWAARLTETLSLRGGVGYTDAAYDSFASAAVVGGALVNFADNKLAEVPEWTGSVMLEYEQPIASDKTLSLVLDYSYKDEFYTDAANTPALLVDSRGLLGGRIGFAASSYEISIWGENLTDKDYVVTSQTGVNIRGTWGMPRSYGVQLSYKF